MADRDTWRIAARVLLGSAAFVLVVLFGSGAWLWFEYHPGPSATLRVVHQVASIALVVLAAGLLFVAIARRLALRAAGIIAKHKADLIKLAVGQSATVKLAGSGTTVQGKIRMVRPTVDPQTRLGTVHITLADTAKARAGMYASATVIAE